MKKRGKNDFWNRREAFARAIERDTKEKSEEVAQRLAQAVRADEEKQAKRQAARAGAGAQKAEPQAPRTDGWGRAQGSPPRTRAGAGNEAQGGAPRAKLSAWGEIAGGVHPRTGAQGGAPHAGPGEWEETPRLHTMELPWPGTGLTGTQPGSMMEETRRRTDLAPGALALLPWPAGPLPKPEGLPRFVDEAPAPGAVPHGAQDGVQQLRAAPQNLQAGLAGSGARAAESPLSGGQLGAARPAFSLRLEEKEEDLPLEKEKDFWDSVMSAVSEPLETIAEPFIQPSTWFSTRNWQDDYEQNLAHDVRGRPVYGQRTDEDASTFQFGEGTGESSGCGAIATYNALYLLGLDPSLANIMKEYRQTGGTVMSGAWGTSPFSAPKVLDKYPVEYTEYTDMYELDKDMQVGDVAIFSLWNDRNDIRNGYHSFAIQKTEDGYISYNWSSEDEEARKMNDIDEVQAGGNFISAYRIRCLPEE